MTDTIEQIKATVETEEMRRLQRDRLAEDVDDGGVFVAVWLLGMAGVGLLGAMWWLAGWVGWVTG
jgi:hypothetical protein